MSNVQKKKKSLVLARCCRNGMSAEACRSVEELCIHVDGKRVCEIERLDLKTDLCVGEMISPPRGCAASCGVPGASSRHAGLRQKESLGRNLRGGGGGVRAWTGGREPEIAYLKRRRICDSMTSHAVETRALPICCEDIAEVRN